MGQIHATKISIYYKQDGIFLANGDIELITTTILGVLIIRRTITTHTGR